MLLLPEDPAALQAFVQTQQATIDQLQETSAQQSDTIDSQHQQIEKLQHELDLFRRYVFGQRRERFVDDPRQGKLFEVEDAAFLLASFFAVPVLVFEKVGPIAALRQSVATKTRRAMEAEDPVLDAFVAAAVFTVINLWLEPITDAHEVEFLGRLATRLAARGQDQ